MNTGRGVVLFFNVVHHAQGRILPLAEPRTRVRLGGLLSRDRNLQGRPRPLLRRPPSGSEGDGSSPHRRCSSASQALGWQVREQLSRS